MIKEGSFDTPQIDDQEGVELHTKSGYSPEELFDVLVALHSPGNEKDIVGLLRKLSRGLVKKTLRTIGSPESSVLKMSITPQARILLNEVANLPEPNRSEFVEKVCSLERKRMREIIIQALNELNDDNIVGVYLFRSAIRRGLWPHDADVKVVVKDKNIDSVSALRLSVEEHIQKRLHVKEILSEGEMDDKIAENLMTKDNVF